MKVYLVFMVSGEGDSVSKFDLEGVFSSQEKAFEYTKKTFPKIKKESLEYEEKLIKSLAEEEIEEEKNGKTFHPSYKNAKAVFKSNPVHEDMNEDNGFTYIGKREDVSDICEYNHFGGFVIEETEVL